MKLLFGSVAGLAFHNLRLLLRSLDWVLCLNVLWC